jgi:AcrR family transcriptional regulator
MHPRDQDLTASARIRNAALALFARAGVAGVTIREVAAAAKVSPGLVQHHFKTKAELCRAVDAYVFETIATAFANLDTEPSAPDLVSAVADRITVIMRDHKLALLYVARAVMEGGEAGQEMFDRIIAVADTMVAELSDKGLMEPDADRRWVALNAVVLRLGTVLFEPAINRHLDRDFSTAAGLDRWNRATTFLFRSGAFRRPKYSAHDKPLPAGRRSR